MKEQVMKSIESAMLNHLNAEQMQRLQVVLSHVLWDVDIVPADEKTQIGETSNENLLQAFLDAKTLEGCSKKTIRYYRLTLEKMLSTLNKNSVTITTEDLRKYLTDYQKINDCSKGNLDNIRRIFSSYFMWLENENYILKSPVRRIHKIKSTKAVKETISDDSMELMRDNVAHPRDLAIIDLLASTGMRVGELCGLNRSDIDFETEDALIDGGLLDSFDIVTLVAEINARLDIAIPAEELIPENFNSAEALLELLERLDEE